MLERDLQRKIRSRLHVLGYEVVKLSSVGAYGSRGWPDLLILGPTGEARFIEVKSVGRVPTKLQAQRIEQLHKLGFRVDVVDSFVAFEALGF